MNLPLQTDADTVTINNLVDRLAAMPIGETGSFVQKQIRDFPYSGRYEPSYLAECQSHAQKAAWSLYAAIMEAYYKLVEKTLPGVRLALNNNAGAYAYVPLQNLIAEYNRGDASRTHLPVFQVHMRTRVNSAEYNDVNSMTIGFEGEVFVRRVS